MLDFSTTRKFDKQMNKIDEKIQDVFCKKLEYFLENPKHPSLHTEKLKYDLHSFRINKNFRVIFKYVAENQVELLFLAGHDVYDDLKRFIE